MGIKPKPITWESLFFEWLRSGVTLIPRLLRFGQMPDTRAPLTSRPWTREMASIRRQKSWTVRKAHVFRTYQLAGDNPNGYVACGLWEDALTKAGILPTRLSTCMKMSLACNVALEQAAATSTMSAELLLLVLHSWTTWSFNWV